MSETTALPAPYYSDDAVTIFHGDALDLLPLLPRVDAVVTDPPYGVGFSEYASHNDRVEDYDQILARVFTAESLIDDGGFCVVFQSEKNVRQWAQWFDRDFRLYAIPKTFGQIGRECVMRQVDYALYWRVSDFKWTRQDWEAIRVWQPRTARNWFLSTDASRTRQRPDHPCPRPLDAMRQIIATFVAPGCVALDPFMGSGTTLRAAKDLGRKAIGIELEEKYCEIAAKRMQQDVLPFNEPKQDAMEEYRQAEWEMPE